MKFAQILYGKAHWIFEAKEKPEYAPNIVVVDITGQDHIQEGWDFNEITGEFTPPEPQPIPEPKASLEEITEETLLETKYQTFILEMMM